MKKFYLIVVALFHGAIGFSQCTEPEITDAVDPDPVCSGSAATLTATTTAGTIYWYESATSTTPVGTGSPFESNSLTTSSSFWVEAQDIFIGPAQSGGGKLSPTGTSGSSVNSSTGPWGLVFNATQDFLLNSVDVFLSSGSPGTVVIDLKDSSFNVLETVSVQVPAGGTGSNPVQYSLPLNLTIPQGNGYRLVVVSNPAMIRDLGTTGNTFPFPIGSVGSITQGTINNSNTSNPGVYYFLYNWNFSPIFTCASDREEVVVTVLPTPDAPVGDSEQEFSEGETLADLDVTGTGLAWYSDADGLNPIPDTTVLTYNTTYYVSQTDGDCTSGMLAITVNNPLSASDQHFTEFAMYPNPVHSRLHIQNSEEISSVEIFTLYGQLVLAKNVNSQETAVDVSNLSAGVYLVTAVSGDVAKTTKLIKK